MISASPGTSRHAPQGSLLLQIAEDAPGWDPRGLPTGYVEKLAEAGLGPILYRLAGAAVPRPLRDLLLGADLTARVLTERMAEAVRQILCSAGAEASHIVLLKGIAAQRHYPEPHLRLMGDIDLLAPPELYGPLQALLRDLGYVQRSDFPAEFFERHHHAMPFFHPKLGLWVEVHRGLFPPSWSCAAEACFGLDAALGEAIPITFRGAAARTLSNEIHLLYTCAHWAGSFAPARGLLPLVDVIYLLRRERLDWDALRRLAPQGWARRALGIVLTYLARHRAISLEDGARAFAEKCRQPLGTVNARLLYRLLDTCLVGQHRGRVLTETNVRNLWDGLLLPPHRPYLNLLRLPLLLLFPPNRADRFSPRLAARRIRSALRGPERR